MSESVKLNLTRVGALLGVVTGVASLFSVWVLLPYRVEAAEKAIKEVQEQTKNDHALLQRIDERTTETKRTTERIELILATRQQAKE